MKKIKRLVCNIQEELCGAKDYAECYLEFKAKNDTTWANRYKEMSNDELRHATYLHDRAIKEIEVLSNAFTPPEEMIENWEKAHKHYVEDAAWVKQMLTL